MMLLSVGGSRVVLLLIGSVLCLSGVAVNAATIFPSNEMAIMEGAGFLAYLVPNQIGDSGSWIHCSLTVAGSVYSLDSDQVHIIDGVTKVQRFSADICGIRVQNVRNNAQQMWTLSALDSKSNEVEQNLKLNVISIKHVNTLNVTVSDTALSYTVTCPEDTGRRYCRILDEADEVYDGCSKVVEITWASARFRCRMLYWGDMDEIETIINVGVEKSKREVTWSSVESELHLVLTCQYRDRVIPCRAVSVSSGRQMLLLDGHLTDRYSAYNTLVSNGTCTLEIRKPFIKEDYGLWRIFLQLSADDFSGCVFNVGSNAEDGLEVEGPPAAKLVEVFHDPQSKSGTDTELSCETSYPIEYCYLSGPQGGNFKPIRFDHLKTLGICHFKVTNITDGKWACGFNDENGGEDRLTYYQVKVYDQPGKVVTPPITASAGDENRRLQCKTILGLQVEICRFISPTGEVHGLSENIVPSKGARFKYYGEGLRTGECGIEISKLENEDFGRWKCSIKVQGRDYAIGLDLIEEVISTTAIVAISVSVTVVACLVGGFFAYKKLNRRRIRYQVNNMGTSVSGLSTDSRDN